MRDAFHEDLDSISDQLVEMTRLAGSAMNRATTALLDADIHLAESVIAADEQIDGLRKELDDRSIDLLARQQPVATDLRMVVTSHADERRPRADGRPRPPRRQGGAAALPRSPPSPPRPAPRCCRWARWPSGSWPRPARSSPARTSRTAVTLERDDDEMDRLHRELFNMLLDDTWTHGTEAAVDLTLVGRYYERFADHAVSMARRVVYLVTGEWHTEAELDGEE